MTYDCELCKDTGETGPLGYLDCVACDAAIKRAALNAAVKALGPTHMEDLIWYAFRAGLMAERNKVVDEKQVSA